jgi:hypothetical protein
MDNIATHIAKIRTYPPETLAFPLHQRRQLLRKVSGPE